MYVYSFYYKDRGFGVLGFWGFGDCRSQVMVRIPEKPARSRAPMASRRPSLLVMAIRTPSALSLRAGQGEDPADLGPGQAIGEPVAQMTARRAAVDRR